MCVCLFVCTHPLTRSLTLTIARSLLLFVRPLSIRFELHGKQNSFPSHPRRMEKKLLSMRRFPFVPLGVLADDDDDGAGEDGRAFKALLLLLLLAAPVVDDVAAPAPCSHFFSAFLKRFESRNFGYVSLNMRS